MLMWQLCDPDRDALDSSGCNRSCSCAEHGRAGTHGSSQAESAHMSAEVVLQLLHQWVACRNQVAKLVQKSVQ